jgi:DNA/RNA-binding domain of Phe-tRNA-synthetase-like protein
VPPGEPIEGFVAPDVRAEFPALRLHWATTPARVRRSPPALRRRLGEMSNRYLGAGVVSMRTRSIPQSYRAFFRQIGLDPDVQRIPSERAAVNRLLHGGFRSIDLVSDACLAALIETGVPVWALDAEAVDPAGPGIRTATAGEADLMPVASPAGGLVVADAARPLAILFEDPPPEYCPGPRTREVVLFTVAVEGVPDIHVDEALWCAADLLGPPERG